MINNIQALRAFAAINVVLYHIIGIAATYTQNVDALQFLKGWGANGVDVFFVISGFVALHTQISRKKTAINFLKTRLVRIIPIYWLLTLIVVFLFFFIPSIFRTINLTTAWVVASLFFMSQPLIGYDPVVYVGWTLEWEMLFYMIFAFSLMASSYLQQILIVNALIIIVAFITGNEIVLEFLLGMFAAYIFHQKHYSQKVGLIILSVGLFLLALTLFPQVQTLNTNRLVFWGIPSLLIVIGAVYVRQLTNRIVLFLGDASYSIYLIQMFAIPAFYKISSRIVNDPDGDILALTCLTFCLIVSCLFYKFIETPMNRYLRGVIQRPSILFS